MQAESNTINVPSPFWILSLSYLAIMILIWFERTPLDLTNPQEKNDFKMGNRKCWLVGCQFGFPSFLPGLCEVNAVLKGIPKFLPSLVSFQAGWRQRGGGALLRNSGCGFCAVWGRKTFWGNTFWGRRRIFPSPFEELQSQASNDWWRTWNECGCLMTWILSQQIAKLGHCFW